MLYDLDRESREALTRGNVSVTSGPPAWSPDGDQIIVAAFTSANDLVPHLVLLEVESRPRGRTAGRCPRGVSGVAVRCAPRWLQRERVSR